MDESGHQCFDALAKEFWAWRSRFQPVTGDDIDRIVRPPKWLPDWRKTTVQAMLESASQFERRHGEIDATSWNATQQVDYALLGSAISRIHWELNLLCNWRRNAVFYYDQAIGPIFEVLVIPPKDGNFGEERSHDLVQRVANIEHIMDAAMENLDQAVKPFALLAIGMLPRNAEWCIADKLGSVGEQLLTVSREVAPYLASGYGDLLQQEIQSAIRSLEKYKAYLEKAKDTMGDITAVGTEAYKFFLQKVALIEWSPERIVQAAQQSLQHCVAQEAIEIHKCQGVPEPKLVQTIEEQIESNAAHDLKVREYLSKHDILSIPKELKRYCNDPIPPYLAPIAGWGCLDDLTDENRLHEDARRYIPEPSASLGFFQDSTARDPRPLIVHEGIPGHYSQLAISWKHENWLRRHFYDSTPNEGIGFYAEELLLQWGYFDDSPHLRKTMFTYMRLRALRVEVDMKLATGEFSIQDASEYLQAAVPMDAETAEWEATFFASVPGQAISYQVGKLLLLDFLVTARTRLGTRFNLRHWHDYVWLNGNVPIALMQKEYFALAEA